MYLELTPEDTVRDLQNLLINAIPGFEFPRVNLFDYTIKVEHVLENQVENGDFIIGVVWGEIPSNSVPQVIVEQSTFNCELTPEEINILAILMKANWLQRQIASIENTRMKFSGSDFKFTSQANHLSKLLSLSNEINRESHHMQRLYKRRKTDDGGRYQSTWSIFGSNSALN